MTAGAGVETWRELGYLRQCNPADGMGKGSVMQGNTVIMPGRRAWIPPIVIAALLVLAMLLAVPPAGAQTTPTDYDTDDDGLIEISAPAQLNAIRHDLNGNGDATHADYVAAFTNRDTNSATRMGCPSGTCTGYELAADLDLSTAYPAWTPLGNTLTPYTATFDGRGRTISGLTVSVSSDQAGLFGRLDGTVRNVGLLNPSVTSAAASQTAGGLVGLAGVGANIETSYVFGGSITVSGASAEAGGLVGQSQATIRASYATAAVGHSGDPGSLSLGGLAGTNWGVAIIASYAAGAVTVGGGSGAVGGGLVGTSDGSAAAATNSYCDSSVMLVSACIGAHANGSTATAAAHSSGDLQTPTGYTAGSIYENWNLNLDGDANTDDDPWDFGTASQYPALKFDTDGSGTATAYEFGVQGRPAPVVAPDPPPPSRRPRAESSPPPYNPAHDHPEIYQNPRHQMATSCAVQTTGEGDDAVSTSTLTFDLGDYTRPITLALSLWDGTHFRSLQSQGIAMPELRQDGQTATVEVVTDPAQTRFRIDSQYGLNLVLGYADCHTDDP